MVIRTRCIAPDFEDHSTGARATPAYCAVLLRVIVLLVNEVRLVENLLRLSQADTVFPFDRPAPRSTCLFAERLGRYRAVIPA